MYREESMKKIAIQTDKLSKTYSSVGIQQHVLKNLDLEIYDGDFTVIMGASGAGKSTLLYALSGMDKPTLGKIHFYDTEISKLSNDKLALFRREHCGFVFQQIHLIDSMSVMDNVLAAAYLLKKDRKKQIRRAEELFEKLGLDESLTRKFPAQLSGGEAQRCGIVRALINEPKVIFADEPTGQLNSTSGQAVLNELTGLHESGQTIVMVTHDLKTALHGNRVIYLRDGIICGEVNLGPYRADDPKRGDQLREFLAEMGW